MANQQGKTKEVSSVSESGSYAGNKLGWGEDAQKQTGKESGAGAE